MITAAGNMELRGRSDRRENIIKDLFSLA